MNEKHLEVSHIVNKLHELEVSNDIFTVIRIREATFHSQARGNDWWHTLCEPITDTKND